MESSSSSCRAASLCNTHSFLVFPWASQRQFGTLLSIVLLMAVLAHDIKPSLQWIYLWGDTHIYVYWEALWYWHHFKWISSDHLRTLKKDPNSQLLFPISFQIDIQDIMQLSGEIHIIQVTVSGHALSNVWVSLVCPEIWPHVLPECWRK